MQALHKFLLFSVLTCLGQNAQGGEIINGTKVRSNTMQYMASLQNVGNQHVCGGFLIRNNFVVTAAHCDKLEPTRVVLGTHYLGKINDAQISGIEMRYKFPKYVSPERGNDIMLLKLSNEVQLDNNVQTIPLPTSDMDIRENETCHVAGWGLTERHHSPKKLRAVDVSIIDLQLCKKEWVRLPRNVICAGGYGTNKGFCQGDSGGPLVCNGTAAGIVSFNRNANCNYPDLPNVYTDLFKFLPWIKDILEGM